MSDQLDPQSQNRSSQECSEVVGIEPISEDAAENGSRAEREVPADEPVRQPTDARDRSEVGGIEPISEDATENGSRAEGEVPAGEPVGQPTDEPHSRPLSLFSATYSPKSLSSITSLHEYDEMLRKEEPQADKSERTEEVPAVEDKAPSGSRLLPCSDPLICVRDMPFIDQDSPEHRVYSPVRSREHAAQLQIRNDDVEREMGRRYRPFRGIRFTPTSQIHILEESLQSDSPRVRRRARKKGTRRCVKHCGIMESIAIGIAASAGIFIGRILVGIGLNPLDYLRPIGPQPHEMPTETKTTFIVVGSVITAVSACALLFALYGIVHFVVVYVMPRVLRRF